MSLCLTFFVANILFLDPNKQCISVYHNETMKAVGNFLVKTKQSNKRDFTFITHKTVITQSM